MSRSWLLYLDDLIASAEKVGRLTQRWSNAAHWAADEAALDAVLFNLQVIGEAIKKLPARHCRPWPNPTDEGRPGCAT